MANNINTTNDHESATIDRDERHPLMDPLLAGIDNNTLSNIINSIMKSNKMNETSGCHESGSTQILLPIDLLVSIDNKSNVPTVQAALPSSFAIQQPFTFTASSISTPIAPIAPITPNHMINRPIRSSLNPSAPAFTPSFTPSFTVTPSLIQPILETDTTNDHDDHDEWCMYDKTKAKHRYFNDSKNKYDRNWRNKSNKSSLNNKSIRWRKNSKNSKNMHVSYRFHDHKTTKLLAEFIRHVTLPNREKYPPNTLLTKTWAMRNCGETQWGYNVELVYCKGDETLSLHHRYPVINAQSGQEIEISANIKTPIKPGRYCTYFRLQKNRRFFGPRVWVDIIVTSLDQMNTSNLIKNCGAAANGLPQTQKAIKWKKKYGTKNEAYNHYNAVSCK